MVIRDIRRALDDDARSPAHLETVSKRGYRLRLGAQEQAPVEAALPFQAARRLVLGGGAVALVMGLVGAGLWSSLAPPPLHVASASTQNDTSRPELDQLSRSLELLVDLHLTALPRVVVSKSRAAAHQPVPHLVGERFGAKPRDLRARSPTAAPPTLIGRDLSSVSRAANSGKCFEYQMISKMSQQCSNKGRLLIYRPCASSRYNSTTMATVSRPQ